MTENKRFTMDTPNEWGFPITDNVTGKVYSCASNQLMKDLCDSINEIVKENKQLKFENNELKCALALNAVDYIIADGKKIDIPPYYEFEQRYDYVMHRREYDGYD